jgi:hypothetical protein
LLQIKGFLGKHQFVSKLNLRPGEIVEVKDENEIFLTLDEHGAYEGLAFTLEMRKYCGKRFKVLRRVNKLLVESIPGGLRSIKDAVILEGVVCSGEIHGGCGKACPLLWKEAWLKRVNSKSEASLKPFNNNGVYDFVGKLPSCQEISLIMATSPLGVWDFRHYLWEISSEANPGIDYLKKAVEWLKFRVTLHMRPGKFKVKGKRKTTPVEVLGLRPGEIVEVKSREEILETLDFKGRNRGLQFMPEMFKYCGKRFRVLKRVDRMVVAASGKMRLIPNTVILEGVYCDGKAHGGCQRMCSCLWREIWLRRVNDA